MTMSYPNLCYNEVCYKDTALYSWKILFEKKNPKTTNFDWNAQRKKEYNITQHVKRWTHMANS